MVGCSIRNCKSKSVKNGTIRFFSFPREESLIKEWLNMCGQNTTAKHGRVCSNHFLPSDYMPKSLRSIFLNERDRGRQLKPDAIPKVQSYGVYTQTVVNATAEENITNVDTSHNTDAKPIVKINVVEFVNSQNVNTSDNVSTLTHSMPAEEISRTAQDHNYAFNVPKNKVESHGRSLLRKILKKKKTKVDDFCPVLKAEFESLKNTAFKFNNLKNNLKKIFTPGQISCLMKPKKQRMKWSDEDFTAALKLRNTSKKMYRHLRATVGFPLPAFSTLRYWASKRMPLHGPLLGPLASVETVKTVEIVEDSGSGTDTATSETDPLINK